MAESGQRRLCKAKGRNEMNSKRLQRRIFLAGAGFHTWTLQDEKVAKVISENAAETRKQYEELVRLAEAQVKQAEAKLAAAREAYEKMNEVEDATALQLRKLRAKY
jgi:uncharacterized membrane-anchored protein